MYRLADENKHYTSRPGRQGAKIKKNGRKSQETQKLFAQKMRATATPPPCPAP
jgi:hypothetical protein